MGSTDGSSSEEDFSNSEDERECIDRAYTKFKKGDLKYHVHNTGQVRGAGMPGHGLMVSP